MSMAGLSSAFLLKSFCQKSMILNSVFFPAGRRSRYFAGLLIARAAPDHLLELDA
jgi:hypothetical protein